MVRLVLCNNNCQLAVTRQRTLKQACSQGPQNLETEGPLATGTGVEGALV